MMQIQNVATSNTNDVKNQATAKLASEKKAEEAKQIKVIDSPKPSDFSRTLEAYSDCV